MALPKLRKIKQTRYFDGNGKRCKKSDPGAIAKRILSVDWYADIPPQESALDRIERRKAGRPAPKPKRTRLCSDKRAAQEMLRKLINSQERGAAGLKDFHAFANQPIGPMIEDFERHLIAIALSPEYIETTLARLKAVLLGCDFLRLVDIDCSKVEQWLLEKRTKKASAAKTKVKGTAKTFAAIAKAFNVSPNTVTNWRRAGAPIIARSENDLKAIAEWHAVYSSRSEIGTTTSDHYVTVLKRFGNWLVKPGRKTESSPFADLDKLNDDSEVRKERRVLDRAEFAELIAATTESEKTFRGLEPRDRAMIYTVAAYTGLRASEIGSLTEQSFDFGSTPTVTVKAAYTKNSELAVIPLRDDLATSLKAYIASRQPATLSIEREPQLLWPGTWSNVGAKMIRIDLAAAKISYTIDGKDYDFHALRHQFITGLARAGVSLKSAQQLARHSKPELTANTYTHLSVRDTSADVEKLAPIPTGERQSAVATGTDPSLATFLATSKVRNQAISGYKGGLTLVGQRGPETPQNTGENKNNRRVANGTRTHNPWNHNPVL